MKKAHEVKLRVACCYSPVEIATEISKHLRQWESFHFPGKRLSDMGYTTKVITIRVELVEPQEGK